MNKKLISIIVPCRERHERTINLLKSIEEMTLVKDRIEVITITDSDRKDDYNNIIDFHNQGNISYDLYNITRKRDVNINKNYYNFGNLLSNAYFCWMLGNDTKIISPNWDEAIYQEMKDHLSYIDNDEAYFYLFINDDINKKMKNFIKESCCFPIVSQNFCKKIRGPFPDYMLNWGADGVLGKWVKCVTGFVRINLIDKVGVLHYSAHTQRTEQDELNRQLQEQTENSVMGWDWRELTVASYQGMQLPDISTKQIEQEGGIESSPTLKKEVNKAFKKQMNYIKQKTNI